MRWEAQNPIHIFAVTRSEALRRRRRARARPICSPARARRPAQRRRARAAALERLGRVGGLEHRRAGARRRRRPERLFLTFPMNKDPERVRAGGRRARSTPSASGSRAGKIGRLRHRGRPVALLAPSSTSPRRRARRWPEHPIEVVPAVSSPLAVAAVDRRAAGRRSGAHRHRAGQLRRRRSRRRAARVRHRGAHEDRPRDADASSPRSSARACSTAPSTSRKATMTEQRIVRDLRSVAGERGDCFAMVVVAKKERAGVLRARVSDADTDEPRAPPVGHLRHHHARHRHRRAPRRRAARRRPLRLARSSSPRRRRARAACRCRWARRWPRPSRATTATSTSSPSAPWCAWWRRSSQNKKVDPAIVCVDDAARFAICVLSGHVGRGNAFTERVAADPRRHAGHHHRLRRARHAHRRHPRPRARLDARRSRPQRHPRLRRRRQRGAGALRAGERRARTSGGRCRPNVAYCDVARRRRSGGLRDPAHRQRSRAARDPSGALRATRSSIARSTLVVGIGCDKLTPPELVARGVQTLLAKHDLALASVAKIATIDLKARRAGARSRSGCRWSPIAAAELDAVRDANPSETVMKHVGTRGVAEPAALLAAGAARAGRAEADLHRDRRRALDDARGGAHSVCPRRSDHERRSRCTSSASDRAPRSTPRRRRWRPSPTPSTSSATARTSGSCATCSTARRSCRPA